MEVPDVAEEEAHGAGAERVGLGLAAVLLVGGAEASDERVEAAPGLAERAGARRRRVRHSEEGAVVVVNLSLPELVEVAQKLQHVRAAAERQRQRRPVVPQINHLKTFHFKHNQHRILKTRPADWVFCRDCVPSVKMSFGIWRKPYGVGGFDGGSVTVDGVRRGGPAWWAGGAERRKKKKMDGVCRGRQTEFHPETATKDMISLRQELPGTGTGENPRDKDFFLYFSATIVHFCSHCVIISDICATSSELASRRIPRIFFSSSFYHRRQSIGIMMFDVSAWYHGPDDVSNYAKQLCEVDGWIVEANQDRKLEILNMT
nr:hypothetical protein Iba_chr05cCG14530 [Ipomoea batatas]